MIPQIVSIGGDRTVTGSCHLLSGQGLDILVDCGTAQGADVALPISEWPVQPDRIDYLFLTHAHLDHIGRLPELLTAGFEGRILCSHPTRALLRPLLRDSLRFEHYDRKEADTLLNKIERMTTGFAYGERLPLKNRVDFSLGRAGHILGSSFVHLFFTDRPSSVPGNTCYSVLFSGDLGSRDTPLLPAPDTPAGCDLLYLESTYGDRLHPDRHQRTARLGQILRQALADRGKVFIPAFALGRTQELLYELDRLKAQPPGSAAPNDLSRVPVFVDSPLGLAITEIYASLSAFWNQEARGRLANGDHPIDFANLYASAGFKDHQQLLDIPGPAIIIAGSGMCTGGRIVEHLRAGLADPRNDILFVGYQARNTLGRALLDQSQVNGPATVAIAGRPVPVRAGVHVMAGYSAHADQRELVDWVESMPQKPGRIELVHGEPEARQALGEKLRQRGHSVPLR